MSMSYTDSTEHCVSFAGDFTAPELRERVKAFKVLYGVQPNIVVVGTFQAQDGETVFGNRGLAVRDIGVRGEWITANVDDKFERIRVKTDGWRPTGEQTIVRLYF